MKKILALMLCIGCINTVFACDVCGGSGGLSGLGFLPATSNHFIGLTYKQKSFNTVHPKLFDSDPTITGVNTYNTAELWGRYVPHKRIQIYGFIPMHSKDIVDTDQTYSLSGLGDLQTLLNIVVVAKKSLRVTLGGGVKIPSGNTNERVNGLVVPNLQLGSGSTDYLIVSTAAYVKDKVGGNLEANYVINRPTNWDYKFGNQTSITALAFYKIKKAGTIILPQIGMNFNHVAKDLSSVYFNLEESFSGTTLLNLPLALDIYKDNYGLRLKYNIPLYHEISKGYVTPKMNFQIQIIYNFFKNTNDDKK